jgi:hypothetical protein
MFLPYLQHGLWRNIWTNTPEPDRLIGPSLPLIVLVSHHQVPRGCSSTESDPTWECLTAPPAGIE